MNTPTLKRYERDEQRRMQAAQLFAQGLSNAEIARRLKVSRMSVSHWYQIWLDKGEEGLKVRLPGLPCRLNAAQKEQIIEALLQGPQAQGFETPLWTLARITQLITKLTGISYHPGHVWYLLKDLDFSCQKPEPVAKERDQVAIDHWLAEEWPRIKKGALERGAKLAFLDESGFSLKPSVHRTWAPKGKTPRLVHRFNWKRLHAIGALICEADGNQADLVLHLQDKSIHEDAIIAYLEALHRQVPGLIVLLLDHLPAHRSQKVLDYMAQNTSWLEVEWFPSYAPELNPTEYFWSATKGKPLANLAPDRLDELEQALHRAHRQARTQPEKLQEFLVASSLFEHDMIVNAKGESQ